MSAVIVDLDLDRRLAAALATGLVSTQEEFFATLRTDLRPEITAWLVQILGPPYLADTGFEWRVLGAARTLWQRRQLVDPVRLDALAAAMPDGAMARPFHTEEIRWAATVMRSIAAGAACNCSTDFQEAYHHGALVEEGVTTLDTPVGCQITTTYRCAICGRRFEIECLDDAPYHHSSVREV